MIRKESRSKIRAKKHYKLRNRINGTSERPRLSVFRSNDHMYAQIIDDTVGNTLVSASTTQKDVKAELEKTNDILKYLGEHKKEGQFLCGFSMETENMIENSRAKLQKKNLDMIVANNLKQTGAGFGTDTNIVTLITKEEEIELPMMSKDEVAKEIVNKIVSK